MGNMPLIGGDKDTWGSLDQSLSPNPDLLTLDIRQRDRDVFTNWVTVKLMRWFHHVFGHRVKKPQDPESGIASYEAGTIQRYTSHVTTIVSSLLPILAIITLQFVQAGNIQLGLITLFSFVFTFCMTIFTTATRGEIFIGTSTLVVSMKPPPVTRLI